MRSMTAFIVVIALLSIRGFSLAAPECSGLLVCVDKIGDAEVCLEPKDVPRWHLQKAREGNARSQYRLGMMLWRGEGFVKNRDAAVHWIRESARNGYAEAAFRFGYMLERGFKPLKKDVSEAKQWYWRADDQGHPGAIYRLARMFERGEGGYHRDYKEASAGFWLAAMGAGRDPDYSKFRRRAVFSLARLFIDRHVDAEEEATFCKMTMGWLHEIANDSDYGARIRHEASSLLDAGSNLPCKFLVRSSE